MENKQYCFYRFDFTRISASQEIYLFSPIRLQEPAVIAVDRLHRWKWQEVLFRPPQREGWAPSWAHRETQGTSTGSATQKTVASAGFLPSSKRIPAVVSKLSTGEEFQRHGDESLTSIATHERAIFYTT